MATAATRSAVQQQQGISPLYYFYQKLLGVAEGGGRTAGRKIGVVQEIVLRKLLERSALVNQRLLFERQLPGVSGATHKVEFVVYALIRRIGRSGSINHAGLFVEVVDINAQTASLQWRAKKDSKWRKTTLQSRGVISKPLADELKARSITLLLPFGSKSVSLLDTSDVLASVESKRVGAQIFVGSDKLGSGIQTIEKAKQTSLVAIDADLKFNRIIRPILLRDSVDPEIRRYISVVVLGNGVHWTANDHNILKTFVDHTYLVDDNVMMDYGRFVEALAKKAGEPVARYFMHYFAGMTKAKQDAFKVLHTSLVVVEPAGDRRSLVQVLEEHILKHNDLKQI